MSAIVSTSGSAEFGSVDNEINKNINNEEYSDDYGLSVFTLDEKAIDKLSKDSANFNNINQQTQVNYKIKGRASCLKTRLRGQTIENGGHFKELHSDGVSVFINKSVLGAFCFPSGIKLNKYQNCETIPNTTKHSFCLTGPNAEQYYGHTVVVWCTFTLPCDELHMSGNDNSVREKLYQPIGFCLTTTNKYHLHNLNYLYSKIQEHEHDLHTRKERGNGTIETNMGICEKSIYEWSKNVTDEVLNRNNLARLKSQCFKDLPLLFKDSFPSKNTMHQESDVQHSTKEKHNTGNKKNGNNERTKKTYNHARRQNSIGELNRHMPNQVDIDMSHAFKCLEPKNILRIFRAILNNEQIILFSNDLHLLFPICETFLALIYPFKYATAYIPVLPLDVAQAEEGDFFNNNFSSFLFGVEKTLLTRCGRLSDNIVQVDLDTNAVWGGRNEYQESPKLPFRLAIKLFIGMLRYGSSSYFENKDIHPLPIPDNVSRVTANITSMVYRSLCLKTHDNDAGDKHTVDDSGKQPNILAAKNYGDMQPSLIKRLKPKRIGEFGSHRRNESVGRGQGIISGNSGFDSSDDESNFVNLANDVATNRKPMVGTDRNNKTTHSDNGVEKAFDQINIQKIFMAFMLSCFKPYAMYMIKPNNANAGSRFDKRGFLHGESRNDQSSPFFEKFINGQMFEVFISTVECRLRHSVFANAAYHKMHKRALTYKTLSRAGYGSFVSIYTNASTFLIKSCTMVWKPYHMWMFYPDSGPILYISNYTEKVDLLTCAINIVKANRTYTPLSTSISINPNSIVGRIKLLDISSALDDEAFMKDHEEELDLLVHNNDLQRLEELRHELLLNAVEHTIKLQQFKVELEIPNVVKENEFTFKVSGTRRAPLKRKLSPFELLFGRSDSDTSEDVNKSKSNNLAEDNDVHGNEESTKHDNNKIVVKKTKKDFEFVIAVSKSITRREWLQRFVWLHRYKQVEKIQDVYSNINHGIHETCDQMMRRMRANSIKSYTLGHDETIDDDGLIWL
eukprot:g6246.t1